MRTVLFLLVVFGSSGCSRDMQDQPRLEPLEASSFFADGLSTRPSVPGTVARDQRYAGHSFYSGQDGGVAVQVIPAPPDEEPTLTIDLAFLQRGRRNYDAFCAPCHDRVGNGNGMVVQRGFPRPGSLHEPRLRDTTPDGQIFDAISRGFRRMPALGDRIPVRDRWAIVMYVRALQISQHAQLDDAPGVIQAEGRQSLR